MRRNFSCRNDLDKSEVFTIKIVIENVTTIFFQTNNCHRTLPLPLLMHGKPALNLIHLTKRTLETTHTQNRKGHKDNLIDASLSLFCHCHTIEIMWSFVLYIYAAWTCEFSNLCNYFVTIVTFVGLIIYQLMLVQQLLNTRIEFSL